LASSLPATPDREGALRRLGAYLTRTEAGELAGRLGAGATLTAALRAVAVGRRNEVRELFGACGLTGGETSHAVAVLHAVEGAHSTVRAVDPIWTMPGHTAQEGPLTSSVIHLVDSARYAVTCSTYNFQRSSGLWTALRRAAMREEVQLRVYVDTHAADGGPAWSPGTSELADHLRPGVVLRTRGIGSTTVRNHAKFLAVDHRFLLVTSANFSWSAEHANIELGVLLDNPALAESVERQMRSAETSCYEHVQPRRRGGSRHE
jgi:phosphatidylserine/phosphatidylglycerophosphate/cardiolipin synthase-like enzyme